MSLQTSSLAKKRNDIGVWLTSGAGLTFLCTLFYLEQIFALTCLHTFLFLLASCIAQLTLLCRGSELTKDPLPDHLFSLGVKWCENSLERVIWC